MLPGALLTAGAPEVGSPRGAWELGEGGWFLVKKEWGNCRVWMVAQGCSGLMLWIQGSREQVCLGGHILG